MKNKIKLSKFSDNEFLFDDCPICQAMAKADVNSKSLSLIELKRVFKKANEENAGKSKNAD